MGNPLSILDQAPNPELLWNSTVDLINRKRNIALLNEIHTSPVWDHNKELRKYKELSWTKDRSMRRVAVIPPEVYHRAIKLYGPDFITDDVAWRKFINNEEIGAWTLTVPKDSI